MEIYEVLYEILADETAAGDYVSFDTTNVDGEPVSEQMSIQSVLFPTNDLVELKGHSDISDDIVVYLLSADVMVRVLGG